MVGTSQPDVVDQGGGPAPEDGRVVLPAEHREALGLRTGDEVIVLLEDGKIRITTLRQAIKRAQEFVRRHVPPGVSLADELVAERRQEAARE